MLILKLRTGKTVKENKNLFLIAILLALLVGAAYQGSGSHQFVGWDDTEYVINNPLVTNPSTGLREIFSTAISLNYHPVTILTMKMNNNKCAECLQGISAKPFIVWNIILHLLNTFLVFYMLWLLSGKKIIAPFLTAALFAVHPMHVESVAWVSERKDVLYTFFFLAGIIAYIQYLERTEKRTGWLIATFVLFVLSCLSKAAAVVFPVVLLLIYFYRYGSEKNNDWRGALKNTFSRKTVLPLLPFFAVSLFFGLMTTAVQAGDNFVGQLTFLTDHKDAVNIVGPLSILQHIQIGAAGFVTYLLKFLVPVNLSPYHPYPMLKEFITGSFAIELWLSVLAFAAIMVFVLLSLKKTKLVFFCLGFYFITIALVLQFVSVGTAMTAERYSYVPYIGLAFLPATLIAESGDRLRKILLVVSAIFIVTLIFLTRHQVKVWTNTETLWSEVIRNNPRLELPRKGRGKYYFLLSSKTKSSFEKNKYEELALADFEIAIANNTRDANRTERSGGVAPIAFGAPDGPHRRRQHSDPEARGHCAAVHPWHRPGLRQRDHDEGRHRAEPPCERIDGRGNSSNPRDDRQGLYGRRRSAPRDRDQHQALDGPRLLSRPASPPWPSGPRSAHAHERAYAQGSASRPDGTCRKAGLM